MGARKRHSPATVVDPKALRAALCVVRGWHKTETTIAQALGVTPGHLERLSSGKASISDNAPMVVLIATALCKTALGDNVSPIDRALLLAHAKALGAYALTAGYRAAEEWRVELALKERIKAGFIRKGYSVAPFLSANGNPILVAIDDRHCLGVMGEATGIAGTTHTAPTAAWDGVSGQRARDDFPAKDLFLPENAAVYGVLFYKRGVHVAPWRPWDSEGGCVLVAVDQKHRLRGAIEVADIGDVAAVLAGWKAMVVVLDCSPEAAGGGYRDWYHVRDDEDLDADGYDPGDSWLKGTQHDPRWRRGGDGE